jgi:hypothetical protein
VNDVGSNEETEVLSPRIAPTWSVSRFSPVTEECCFSLRESRVLSRSERRRWRVLLSGLSSSPLSGTLHAIAWTRVASSREARGVGVRAPNEPELRRLRGGRAAEQPPDLGP